MLQLNSRLRRCAVYTLTAALVFSACGSTAGSAALPEETEAPVEVTPAAPEDLRAITLTGGEVVSWSCGIPFE